MSFILTLIQFQILDDVASLTVLKLRQLYEFHNTRMNKAITAFNLMKITMALDVRSFK